MALPVEQLAKQLVPAYTDYPGHFNVAEGVWQDRPNLQDASMLWAAACMCSFGFLRVREEVVPSDTDCDSSVHFSYGDVRADNASSPQSQEVRIKASKADPFRKGVSVQASGNLCPVVSILNYMVRLRAYSSFSPMGSSLLADAWQRQSGLPWT